MATEAGQLVQGPGPSRSYAGEQMGAADVQLSMPRPRRASAASSFRSLASSAASQWYDDSPETSAEGQYNSALFQRAALLSTNDSDGFLVGLAPGQPQALVPWADLVTLLIDPAATARLPAGHLIADVADSIAARLERDPGAFPFVTSPTDERHFASVAGQLTNSPPRPCFPPEISSGRASGSFYDPSQPRLHGLSGFPPFTAAAPPVQQLPREPLPPPHSTACVNPVHTLGYAERGAGLEEAMTALPTPPARFQEAQAMPSMDGMTVLAPRTFVEVGSVYTEPPRNSPSVYGEPRNVSARRSASRQRSGTQSPYHRPPLIQTAHLSASSLHEFAGGIGPVRSRESSRHYQHGEVEEPATAVPPGLMVASTEMTRRTSGRGSRRYNGRPLNESEETYYWSSVLQSLVPVTPDLAGRTRTRPAGELLIVFPPGSYSRVFVDGTEALPSDTRGRVNDWLRGQSCVEGCSFRFEAKRPSVIRQHVTGCKARAQKLSIDPLKELCQLQLEMQSQDSRARQTSKLRRFTRATARQDEDDAVDGSSIVSYGSYRSSGGGENSPRTSWYSNELPVDVDDANMNLEGHEEDLAMPDSDPMHSIPPLPPAAWTDAGHLLAAEQNATSSLAGMASSSARVPVHAHESLLPPSSHVLNGDAGETGALLSL
ncbi:hypothetical protein JCM3774_005581 [Rhodotorula dairenensis]